MITKFGKEVIDWGRKVGPKMWSTTKSAPSKVKKYATDSFSKFHQSDQYRKASIRDLRKGFQSYVRNECYAS